MTITSPLREVMGFAAANVRSTLLIRGSHFAADHRAASDECCFTFKDIECVGLLVMYFDLPRTSARQNLNIEVWLPIRVRRLSQPCRDRRR